MTKDDKFKIGMALHKISMASDDMTFQRISESLKTIEDIVTKEPTTDEATQIRRDIRLLETQSPCRFGNGWQRGC